MDEDGNKERRGPWNQQEEARLDEEWKASGLFLLKRDNVVDLFLDSQKRYEMEASKLRAEYEQKDARYEGYIERLERKAGHSFRPGENGMLYIYICKNNSRR